MNKEMTIRLSPAMPESALIKSAIATAEKLGVRKLNLEFGSEDGTKVSFSVLINDIEA